MPDQIVERESRVIYDLEVGEKTFTLDVLTFRERKEINYSLISNNRFGIRFKSMTPKELRDFSDMLKQVAVKIEEILKENPEYKLEEE